MLYPIRCELWKYLEIAIIFISRELLFNDSNSDLLTVCQSMMSCPLLNKGPLVSMPHAKRELQLPRQQMANCTLPAINVPAKVRCGLQPSVVG